MRGEDGLTEEEWHRKGGVDLFNQVRTLTEKEDRTAGEDDEFRETFELAGPGEEFQRLITNHFAGAA